MAGQLLQAKTGICAQRDRDMDRARGRGVDICSQGLTNAWMDEEERRDREGKREEVGLGQGSRII